MIISVNFPAASTSTSTPRLPTALAKISHNELVLIELQGELEVECTNDRERDGRLVGRLSIDDAAKKPTLMIGHHLLEGKVAQLPKSLAVLQRVQAADPGPDLDAMECDIDSNDDGTDGSQKAESATVSWDAIAVVKRKIVFSKRPMPIVGRPS
ncbi:Ctf8-domain-containing protein [Mycena capillaripes]|nr:Ctf8-domain-containing protein [Mycena capillaripes]